MIITNISKRLFIILYDIDHLSRKAGCCLERDFNSSVQLYCLTCLKSPSTVLHRSADLRSVGVTMLICIKTEETQSVGDNCPLIGCFCSFKSRCPLAFIGTATCPLGEKISCAGMPRCCVDFQVAGIMESPF